MEAKDVKVDGKYVPITKSIGFRSPSTWDEFCEKYKTDCCVKFFKANGFLVCKQIDDDSFGLGCADSFKGDCYRFLASDFSPAEIEVDDEVRGGSSVGIVYKIDTDKQGCPTGYHFRSKTFPATLTAWSPSGMVELIRKAKKPEQKKEDKPMSRKPRLEDINERTLCKTRGCGLAVAIKNVHSELCFYNQSGLRADVALCCVKNSDWFDDNTIVAIKRFDNQTQALSALLSNTEPAWDWTEDMDKPVFKIGDWVEVVENKTGGHDAGTVGLVTETYVECGQSKCVVRGTTGKWSGHGLIHYQEHLKPYSPPAPVQLTPAQIAEIKAKYGNGADVLLPLDGKTVKL